MKFSSKQLDTFAALQSQTRKADIAKQFINNEKNARIDKDTGNIIIEQTNAKQSVIELTDQGITGITTTEGRQFSFPRDKKGRIKQVKDPLNRTLDIDYDEQAGPVLDNDGQNISAWPIKGIKRNGQDLLHYHYLESENTLKATFADGSREQLEFDNGLLTRTVNANGIENRFIRDANMNLVEIIDGRGYSTRFNYDSEEITPPGMIFPDGTEETLELDAKANLLFKRNGQQYATVISDDSGNAERAEFSDGHFLEVKWDNGKPVHGINEHIEVDFVYDDKANPVSEKQGEINIQYQYDDDDNLVTLKIDDNKLNYSYDADGLVSRIIDWNKQEISFSHDLAGSIRQIKFPNGVTTNISINQEGHDASITSSLTSGNTEDSIIDEHYSYDKRDRLIDHKTANTTKQYSYDKAGQLLQCKINEQISELFDYDAAGNRTQKNNETAEYDVCNRVLNAGGEHFSYDEAGNLTKRMGSYGSSSYFYNGQGHLTEAVSKGKKVEFLYDAFGRRVIKRSGNTTTHYVWAGRQILQEWTENDGLTTERRDYVYYPGERFPIAVRINDQAYYYHNDRLGTPLAMTDSKGKIVWKAEYSAFGEANILIQEISQPIRFLGQYSDEETDLYYNTFRYYDPKLGRYISPDPLRYEAGSTNFYLYANNDPINQSDPDGLLVFLTALAIVGVAAVVGGLIGGAISAATAPPGEKGSAFLKGFGWGAVAGAVGAAVPLIGAAAGLGTAAIAAVGLGADAIMGGIEACATAGGGVGTFFKAAGISVATTVATLGLSKIPGVKKALGAAGKGLSSAADGLMARGKKLFSKAASKNSVLGKLKKSLDKARKKAGKLFNGKKAPNKKKTTVCGKPVNLATGEELLEQTDFILSGPLPLSWTRTYRTSNPFDLNLGHGWTHPLSVSLIFEQDIIYYHDEEGRKIPFSLPQTGQASHNRVEQMSLKTQEDGLYRIVMLDVNQPDRLFKLILGKYRLYALQDDIGNSLKCQYNTEGQIVQLMGSWGKGLGFQYQGQHLTQIDELIANNTYKQASNSVTSDPLQRIKRVNYQYNQKNDLIAVVDPAGQKDKFSYKNHIIIQRTQKCGFSINFEWDQYTIHGKCLHQWDDIGTFDYHFEWDDETHISRVIDANDGILVTHFNELGLPVLKIEPEGGEIHYEYDGDGLLTKVTNPMDAVTEYQYNEQGRIAEQTDQLGNQQSITYHDNGKPATITDANGNDWLHDYDEQGLLSVFTDPEGNRTQYRYNHLGQVALIKNALEQTTQLMWSSKGELLAEKIQEGPTTQYQYNQQGLISAVQTGQEPPTEYQYDVLGNIIQIKLPNGQIQFFEYHVNGQLSRYTDEAGRQTQYQYDGLSQIIRRIDPMGQMLNYIYDKERNLTALRNEKGETYHLQYDKNDRLIAEIGFDGRRLHYRYDAAGHLIELVDGLLPEQWDTLTEQQQSQYPEPLITAFHRDPLGQLIEKITADDSSTFSYNPLGQLELAKNSEAEVSFDYDSLGNLIAETQQQNDNSHTLQHTCDALGNRIESIFPDGQVVEYGYDSLQLFTRISLDGNTITQVQRDQMGREITKQQGKLSAQYQYDPMGRLINHKVVHQHQQHTIIQRDYAYNQAGNLASIDDLKKGTTHYHYDPLDRLSQVDGFVNEQFAFDPAGNLLEQKNSLETSEQSGNPTPIQGNRLLFQGDRKFQYDNRGNLILEQRGTGGKLQTQFVYDSSNQLVGVSKQNLNSGKSSHYHYHYDALGRRISKMTPEGELLFLWNGDVLLSEQRVVGEKEEAKVSADIEIKTYLYEPDSFRPVAIVQNQQVYHYHLDHLGTPQEITDNQGELVWSVYYRAYGNVVKKVVESLESNLRFQGQYYDEETGLHYNRFRYYDPSTARFVNQDPIGLSGGINSYEYVINPIEWVDPFGLMKCKEDVTKGSPSPALKSDPYHPDSVAARQKEWQKAYGGFDPKGVAKDLGYGQRIAPQKAPFNSHGQPVFSNGKGYISPDIDGHNITNGWKMFDKKGRRTGTWNFDLSERLKD